MIGLVILANVAVLICCLRFAIREKRTWVLESDVAFCFALNQQYATSWVQRFRMTTVLFTFVPLACSLVIAYRRGSLIAIISSTEAVGAMFAFVTSLWGLFAPEKQLARVPWRVFLSRMDPASAFEWGDLLMSAPQNLKTKLVRHATEEEYEEMRAEFEEEDQHQELRA